MMKVRLLQYTRALLAAYAIFALGLLMTCLLILNEVQDITTTTEKLHIHPFAVSNAALEAKAVLTAIRERILYAVLTQDQDNAEAAMGEIARLDDEFFNHLATVFEFYLGDTAEGRQVDQLFRKWRPVRDDILESARAGEFGKARELIMTMGTPAYEEIRSKLDEITEFARRKAVFFIGEARHKSEQTQRTVYLTILLGFATSCGCGFFMVRKVQLTISQNEATLNHKAHHDALTGLPNRALFLDRLGAALDLCKRNGSSVAVMFLDLDGFKAVNDTLGHEAGDELLISTARRLTDALRGEDTIARLGGDEFVVLIPGLTTSRAIDRVVQKVTGALDVPVRIKTATLHVSASMGLAVYPRDGSDPETLLAGADAAMYVAKARRREGKTAADPSPA